MSKYHWRNGWYFERLENGTVTISKQVELKPWEKDTPYPPYVVMEIPAGEWVSIVTEVSANPTDYVRAESFHQHPVKE